MLCFNSQRDGILRGSLAQPASIKTRFNSQRDGILRGSLAQPASIKTRFNSQRDGILHKTGLAKASEKSSFNSQRDGILLALLKEQYAIGEVSIPNGMEFYAKAQQAAIERQVFQFPTGWNSTGSGTTAVACKERFNSQRDGILPISYDIHVDSKEFQFPTGWNSTISDCETPRMLAFQFPTGWNSTRSRRIA